MNTVKDITFITIVEAALGCIAYMVASCASTVTPTPEPCAPGCCPAVVAPAEDELCGRYHLRKRTNRFFKRSIG